MPIQWLEHIKDFPDPNLADNEGLVAVGGELSPEWLLQAYSIGLFPWFNEDDPILWWSPNPRMILYPNKFKVSKSFRNTLNQNKLTVTFNKCFKDVIENCGTVERNGQAGTWLTKDMKEAYNTMHELGWAHSVEVWLANELVGGLYGLAIGKVFFGESMFSKVSNASKVGLYSLCETLKNLEFEFIDCQVYTSHLESLGAQELARKDFLNLLETQSSYTKLKIV